MVRMVGLPHWLALATLGMAAPVLACPVCGVGQGETASLYLITAGLLSALPLFMLAGVLVYLCRRARYVGRERAVDAFKLCRHPASESPRRRESRPAG